jgi:hypothetical protein
MASKRKPHNLIPKEPAVHMNVRLPKSLHRAIKAAARKNRTSLHAEMLERLRRDLGRLEDHLVQMDWIGKMLGLIWRRLDGQQATAGKAPQNGPAPQERAPQGCDG